MRSGKSVRGRILTSPRMPWVPTIRPTTRPPEGVSVTADLLDHVILHDDLRPSQLLDQIITRLDLDAPFEDAPHEFRVHLQRLILGEALLEIFLDVILLALLD